MEKYISFEEFASITEKMMKMRMASGKMAHSYYEGIKLPDDCAKVARDYKTWEVRPDDVWIITYPKAGTTWAQEIMSCVMHDGNVEEVSKRYTMFRVLFVDWSLSESMRSLKNIPETHRIAEELPSPRVLKSHMPGQLLPPQIWTKKPRIVYVIRNPKDLAVAYFHFMKMRFPVKEVLEQGFADFLDEMLSGDVPYGPWWEHYLYFWKKRHDENILLLRFEDMKRNLRGAVEKISKFLGKNLPEPTLDAITEHCTFVNMKKNPMSNLDSVIRGDKSSSANQSFMRKGKVGDWKSHFTVAQNEAMDAFIEEKLRGSGLVFNYE